MFQLNKQLSAIVECSLGCARIDLESVRPKHKKELTDKTIIFVFLSFFITLTLLSHYGLTKGQPDLVFNGVDSWGNICGKKKNILKPNLQTHLMDHKEQPFEFHFKSSQPDKMLLPTDFLQRQTDDIVFCVKECPRAPIMCKAFVEENGYNFNSSRNEERLCRNGSVQIFSFRSILNKCFSETQVENNLVHPAFQILDSLNRYKKDLLYLSCISLIFSIGFFLMFEIITTIMANLSCVLAGISCFIFPLYFWSRFALSSPINTDLEAESSNQNVSIAVAESSGDHMIFLGYSVFASLLMLLVFFCLKLLGHQRKKTVGILNEVSYLTCSLPSTTLQPLFRLAVSFCLTAIAGYIGMYFFFLQEPYIDQHGAMGLVEKQRECHFIFLIVLAVGFFYVGEVFLGCQRVVLAGMFSKWYFVSNEKKEAKEKGLYTSHPFDKFSFVYPLGHLMRYNFGSVCLASFLIPPFQIGRLTLTLIYRKIRKRKPKKVRFTSADSCCGCCWWLKRILQYISYYNYICIAMYGLSFWESGKKSARLLSKVPHILGTKIRADITLFLAKLSVVFCVAFISFMYFKTKYHFDISTNTLIPITVSCILAYFIASCFFSIQEVALDTMILNYCDDMKRNNGQNRPYFARNKLKNFMAKPKHRREGWSNKTLKIPYDDTNDDPRIFLPNSSGDLCDSKRVRPKAARGKRRSPDDTGTENPKQSKTNDSISLDGSVQILVDRFDMLVDKMMSEREKSPLSKMYKSETPEKQSETKLPPINLTQELPATSAFTEITLSDQLLLLDVSDSDSSFSKQETSKTPIPKPVRFSIPGVESHLAMNNPPRAAHSSASTFQMQDLPGCTIDDESSSAVPSSREKKKEVRSTEMKVDSKNNPAEPYVTINFFGDLHTTVNSS